MYSSTPTNYYWSLVCDINPEMENSWGCGFNHITNQLQECIRPVIQCQTHRAHFMCAVCIICICIYPKRSKMTFSWGFRHGNWSLGYNCRKSPYLLTALRSSTPHLFCSLHIYWMHMYVHTELFYIILLCLYSSFVLYNFALLYCLMFLNDCYKHRLHLCIAMTQILSAVACKTKWLRVPFS